MNQVPTSTTPEISTPETDRFQLGEWTLCTRSNRLIRGNEVIDLEHRLVVLLQFFIAHPDQLLSKESLLANIWSGRVVNDDSLAVAVSHLRKALGDDARAPRFIKTIPGRGYVWIGGAAAAGNQQAASTAWPRWIYVVPVLLGVAGLVIWYALSPPREQAPLPVSGEVLAQAEARLTNTDPEQWRLAIRELRHWLVQHPDTAEAYGLIVRAKLRLLEGQGLDSSCDELLGLIERSLQLQPDQPLVLMEQGNLLFWCRHGQEGAEASYRRAMSLAPEDARIPMQYAQLLLAQGRFEESLAQMELSRRLNPLNYSMPLVVWILQMQRRDEQALAEWERITRAEPDDVYYHISAQRIFARLGRESESFEHWLWLMRHAAFDQAQLQAVADLFAGGGLTAVNRWLLEQRVAADLGHYTPPLAWARYALAAGDPEAAMSHLEAAAAVPQLPLLWAGVDPAYDALRDHPRFQALIAGLGVASIPVQTP